MYIMQLWLQYDFKDLLLIISKAPFTLKYFIVKNIRGKKNKGVSGEQVLHFQCHPYLRWFGFFSASL